MPVPSPAAVLVADPDSWRITFHALRGDFAAAASANPQLQHLVAEEPRFTADGHITPDLPERWQEIVEGYRAKRHPFETGRNAFHQTLWYRLEDRKAVAYVYGPGEDLKRFERLAACAWTALPEKIANLPLQPGPDPNGWPRLYVDPPDKKAPPAARHERWSWFMYWLLSQHPGSYVLATGEGAATITRLTVDPFTASRDAIDILLSAAGPSAPAGGRRRPEDVPPPDGAVRGKRGTVNQRMLEELHGNPESVGWTQRKWAVVLGCKPSAVAKAPAWQTIKAARAMNAAERRDRTETWPGK
jgi:hypothetical protein